MTKIAPKLKGGGGTTIKPAMRKGLRLMDMHDVVIVFTDGYIYDIDDAETRNLMKLMAQRAGVSIFATTGQMQSVEGWKGIKIDID